MPNERLNIPSLQQAVYERLRESLMEGAIHPSGDGRGVPLSDVAQRLGVSTMPVREAVRRLQAEGLVTFDRRNGIQPALLSPLEFEEITELRVRLETLAFERAMAHSYRVDRERLGRLLDEMEHTEDRRDWRRLNYEFHDALYESGDYPRLLKMISTLRIPVEPYLRLYTSDPPDLHGERTRDRLLFDDHRALVEALDRRDLKEGLRLVEQHIRRFRSLASRDASGDESGTRESESNGEQSVENVPPDGVTAGRRSS